MKGELILLLSEDSVMGQMLFFTHIYMSRSTGGGGMSGTMSVTCAMLYIKCELIFIECSL